MSLFGYIYVLFPLCPEVSRYMAYLVSCFCLVGSIFVGLSALYYTDLKKIIAASSIVHMSYAVIGIFSFNPEAVCASVVAMFAHGIISSGLFFSIGSLYNRYSERDLSFFSNLTGKMSDLGFNFFFLSFANAAFPATIGYLPEVMILVASTQYGLYMPVFLLIPLFINGAYNIWAITRLCFGPEKPHQVIEHVEPLSFGEMYIFYTCFILILALGFHPSFLMQNIDTTLTFIYAYE